MVFLVDDRCRVLEKGLPVVLLVASQIQVLLTTPLAKYTPCFASTIKSSAPSGDRRFTMPMGISSLFDFSRTILSPWKDGAMRRSASVQESFVRACVQLT